jgi:putative membrane-bound dehydrogenase-like protein
MKSLLKLILLLALPLAILGCVAQKKTEEKKVEPKRLELLFLGHESKHHDAHKLADILAKEFFTAGMNITYTSDPDVMLKEDFQLYDGLILYANHDTISMPQRDALLNFVASGKGFIPLHSASFCFRNSPEAVALIGGQFQSHKGGPITAEIIKPNHPALTGVEPFTTEWDETYVHTKIADDIEVLMERVEGDHREPYTWVKNFGSGRVFYTAFGHDERTFNNPGFIQLVKSGIIWAVGDEATAKMKAVKMVQPTYEVAKMPNYEKKDPIPMYQLPLSPEESQTLIQVPVGFKLELFASEPDIKNPIAMEWDERGRLWVVETVDYPNTVRDDKGEGDDRIIICEDTDGDGKADKFTTFADKLNIPTAFTFSNGGIIVAQAPHFLFLIDTDGDDKADVREILISGWGTFDTHAGPSNLKYGFDNNIWGTVGYSSFEGKVGDSTFKFGQGLYKFNPKATTMEYQGSTSNNTWGLGFSEEFDIFVSTANNDHSDYVGIPQKYLQKANLRERGLEKTEAHYNIHPLTKELRQVDVFNGFTAAAGHNLYTARHFPKEFWNSVAFITEPTGRLVHKHVLGKSGSGFKEIGDGWNIVASSDNWFGPVEAKVGPDGALWILDWYNFIIQHNPTPEGFDNGKGNAYIDPLRDNKRGRIYKLVHESSQPSKYFDVKANPFEALKSDNMFWRMTAQRLLVESGNKSVSYELHKLIQNTSTDEINTNGAALHSLWTLHGLNLLDGSDKKSLDVALKALRHPAPGVRKAAVQTLPVQKPEVAAEILKSGVLSDPDLRVRLAAFLVLSDAQPSEQIGKAVLDAVQEKENADDKWVSLSLLIAGNAHRAGFMKAYHHTLGHPSLSNTEGTLAERIFAGDQMDVVPLEGRATLARRQLPDFSGKELTFVADVSRQNRQRAMEGVLVSYGTDIVGFGVWVKDKKVHFQINQGGEKSILTSNELPSENFKVKASLLSGGEMTLSINGQEVAKGKTKDFFDNQPNAILRMSHNQKPWFLRGETIPNVGDYPQEFNFEGAIKNARFIAVKGAEKEEVKEVKVDQSIVIKAVVGQMKYNVKEFSVKAGQTIKIIFENPDHMQHNLLVIKPGTLNKVGALADQMALLSNAAELAYVPNSPDVLHATPLLNPEEKYELTFKVPDTPGNYPFVCTFPGHWRIMFGNMKVTK